MNTHPETPAPTDPTDLAREVLAAEKVRDDTPGLLYLDGPTHEHEEAAGAILDAAPDLARAVLNVKKLADDYVALASQCMTDGDVADAIDWENAASLILAALNGGNA